MTETIDFEVVRASRAEGRRKWHDAWERLPVERRDVYFRPEYLEPLEAIGRGQAMCVVASKGDAILLYPFLRSRIGGFEGSIPEELTDVQSGYGYGGPVVNDQGEDEAFLEAVWDRFSSWAVDEKVIAEFVRFHPLIGNERWAPRGMRVTWNRATIAVDLATYPEAVWSDPYYRVHRHMVRRAERAGYTYESIPYEGDLGWLASMYEQSQERLGGGPETRFNENYFNTIRDSLGHDAWLGVVRNESEIVVAALVLNSEAYAHCHLMGYRRSRMMNGMTNLVYHGIYLQAARSGRRLAHMGGGTSAAEGDSLFKFKKSLSPLRRDFHIGTIVRDARLYDQIARVWTDRNGPGTPGYFLFYRVEQAGTINAR